MHPTDQNTRVVRPAVAAAPVTGSEQSAVSWAAVFAGAAAAAALSLALLLLGAGLGLSMVSPWSFEGVSAETFGWSTIAWITFISFAASALGGYLTGRLRTRWLGVHTDETYFRDTAHGFLAWAVSILLTAALLTSAIGAILGTGMKVAGSVAGAAAGTAGSLATAGAGAVASEQDDGQLQYWVDTLLRRMQGTSPASQQAAPQRAAPPMSDTGDEPGMATGVASAPAFTTRGGAQTDSRSADDSAGLGAEIARILSYSLRSDALDPDDSQYIAQRVAERTGLSQAEAQQRITEVEARMRTALDDAETAARETADEARKASAYAALWLFITLLIGAFTASLMATFGGRQRDL